MDQFSKMDGPGHITPVTGNIWQVQKKRKIKDQDGREKKDRYSGKGERSDKKEGQSGDGHDRENGNDRGAPEDFGDDAGYGLKKTKNKLSRKIDVVI